MAFPDEATDLLLGWFVRWRTVVFPPARTPLVVTGVEMPLMKVGRPRRRGNRHDVALPHRQRICQSEGLLFTKDFTERHHWALPQDLVASLLLVLDDSDASCRLLSELLVAEQCPEVVSLWILLG